MAGVADVERRSTDSIPRAVSDDNGRDGSKGPDVNGDGRPIGEDELFELLSNRRRRYAVHLLKRLDEPVELGDMAEQIAAWENEIDRWEVDHAQRKRVYTALQQIHLPRMADSGIVAFDDRAGVVEPTAATEQLRVYVDVVKGRDLPWSGYYLGLTVTGVIALAAAYIGVWPFAVLPDLTVGLFVIVSVGVFALAHTFYMTRYQLGATEKPPELEYQ